jgi:hypothetical protein
LSADQLLIQCVKGAKQLGIARALAELSKAMSGELRVRRPPAQRRDCAMLAILVRASSR